MFRAETVTILRPSVTYEERKDAVTTWTPETLDGVLFDSPSTEDVDEAMRAYGVHVQYRMHVPKSYTASLRGCKVVRDRDSGMEHPLEYVVAGDPMPLAQSPQPWDRSAMLGWFDG
jgi:hypothetical protein